jgi:hypothetical protein
MKIIESKYKSRCRICGEIIFIAENVYWEKNKGVIHINCFEGKDKKEEQKSSIDSKKNYFLIFLRIYMFLAPLFYGPVYQIKGMSDAITYCLSVPLLIAILTGLKPTSLRVRVKWSSRRAYQGDVFATLVLFEVAFSYVITWIIKSLVSIMK